MRKIALLENGNYVQKTKYNISRAWYFIPRDHNMGKIYKAALPKK